MQKYSIDNFYVGNLNLGYRFGNLLIPYQPTDEDKQKNDLKYSTVFRGAISIDPLSTRDITDWQKRIHFSSLFTIFYKIDDNTFICLHNSNIYHTEGEDYCSNLVPLTSCLPPVASKVGQEVSCIDAKRIFDCLFKKSKRTLYNQEQFYLDNFYFGNLELFTGAKNVEGNFAQRLILSANGISPYGGCIKTEEQEDSYSYYSKVILLLPDILKPQMVNINENRVYDSDSPYPDGSKVELNTSLADEEFFTRRIHGSKASIPQVLKLQKKYIQKETH